MTAAQRAAWNARVDVVAAFISRCNAALVVIAIALVIGVYLYRSAKSEGERIGRDAVHMVIVAALADSSRVIEARLGARRDSIDVAAMVSAAAREIYIPARAKIVLQSDTVVSVVRQTDTLRVEVPREIGQVIQAGDSLHRADSSQIVLLRAQLVDVTADRDVWKHRARLTEQALKDARPSRFGFKAGAALGAVSVVALVSLLR